MNGHGYSTLRELLVVQGFPLTNKRTGEKTLKLIGSAISLMWSKVISGHISNRACRFIIEGIGG